MAKNSKIEWTTHTANMWHGCQKVHAGCDNCYAETMSHRWKRDLWGKDKPRLLIKKFFPDLDKFQQEAKAAGEIHRVFVGSMMDIFEKSKPLVDGNGSAITKGFDDDEQKFTGDLREEFFNRISAGRYPDLMFLLLTKRPSNINKMIPTEWKDNPPVNVMFGTSPVDQETADKLVLQLLEVNGKRFLSCEPLLGKINLYPLLDLTIEARTGKPGSAIDWIIVGGESGYGRRPFNLEWGRDLREQCKRAGVPFFFKQIDKILPIPEDLLIREFP